MSMQAEGDDAKGRNYHQTTKNGTGSAASVGTGGTGATSDIRSMGTENGERGSAQKESRSDDLLAGDTTAQEADQAFSGGSQGGTIRTGMEGIGKGDAGNRQSGQQSRQGEGELADSKHTDVDQYDQGTAKRER
ncbi:MAG: hypothetical protein ACRYGO_12170 [Janthinobacterium lividum]